MCSVHQFFTPQSTPIAIPYGYFLCTASVSVCWWLNCFHSLQPSVWCFSRPRSLSSWMSKISEWKLFSATRASSGFEREKKKEKHQQVKIHRCTFIQFAKGLKSVQLNLFAIRQQTRRVFPHRHSITSSLGLSPSNKDYSSVITWQLHKAWNNQIREIIHRTSTGDA